MAKSELFKTLRKRGLRKRAARAVADAERGEKSSAAARQVLADLDAAADAIRRRVTTPDTRKQAGKKAAATRKRDAAKRSDAATRSARTRKARKARTRSR